MDIARILLFVVIVTSLQTVDNARILAVVPLWAGSHHMIIQPILRALADAGHTLVVYSPFTLDPPHPNYTDVALDSIDTSSVDTILQDISKLPHWKCLDNMLHIHDILIHNLFQNKNIKNLLKSNEHFDLVFTEPFVAQEFTLVFGHIFKAPVIGLQTFFTTNLLNIHMGNAISLASIPDGCFPYSNKMNFFQRFLNLFCIIRGNIIYFTQHIPTVERKLRKYIPDSPPLLELTKTVSLMFINDHMTADYSQPRPPTMIPVAGIHIKPEKPLPQDIKSFMDKATHGVILFSMGSLVPDDQKPKEYFETYINIFKKLKQSVIWKSRKDKIEGLPSNVMLVKWMPQRDVLAHPNCVLFLTHGGLASQHEAIYNSVPVVAVPHFADQFRNAEFYEAQQVGINMPLSDLTESTMLTAITTVLEDPKYKENMQRLSRIFRDLPMSPSQTVVYWTEYVLRHGGAPHLKPASTLLSWYQLAMLDVLAAIAVLILAFSSALYFLIKKIIFSVRVQNVSNKSIKTD